MEAMLNTNYIKFISFLFILIPSLLKSQVKYVFLENAFIEESPKTFYLNTGGPEFKIHLSRKNSLSLKSFWIGSPVGIVFKQNLINKDNFNFSVMSMVGSSGYLYKGKIFGGLYMGVFTFGSSRKNISFSGGLAHINWPTDNYGIMFSNRQIGDKYSYSFYDQNHPYFIPEDDYNAQMAFEDSLGLYNWHSNSHNRYLYRNQQLSTVIGVSGLIYVRDRVSIILESILLYSKKPQVEYINREKEITYERYNNATGNTELTTFNSFYGEGFISNEKIVNTTLLLSPCIRFEKKNIFQLGLTVIANKSDDNYTIVPIPQFSFVKRMN